MPDRYVRVGTLKTGKPGRPKTLLEDSVGNLFIWKRVKGGWRPRTNRRTLQSQWEPGRWVEGKGNRRGRLAQVWRVRRCSDCHETKYVWSQIVWQSSWKDKAGKWQVRSYPLKLSQVRHPGSIHIEEQPKVECRCLGKNNVPTKSQVETFAIALEVRYGGFDRPAGPSMIHQAASW